MLACGFPRRTVWAQDDLEGGSRWCYAKGDSFSRALVSSELASSEAMCLRIRVDTKGICTLFLFSRVGLHSEQPVNLWGWPFSFDTLSLTFSSFFQDQDFPVDPTCFPAFQRSPQANHKKKKLWYQLLNFEQCTMPLTLKSSYGFIFWKWLFKKMNRKCFYFSLKDRRWGFKIWGKQRSVAFCLWDASYWPS